VSIVYVSRNLLLFAWNFDSKEDDGQPPSIEYFFFSFCKEVEEGVVDSFGGGGGK
jgi:hypothetical protein